ncbi:VWA domain-containing protein [Frigoribacterium sp. 2-23]|uniref:VWA domain-containing protein n=1 Tax=Frigoribacterium sp. 2-23 TaxID=3415006 RepID=UPI003C6EC27A
MTGRTAAIAQALVFQPVLPWWLLGVFAVLLLGVVVWRIVAERSSRRLLLTWVRRGLIVALLLVIAARPGVPGGSAQASVAKLNVFFVVDTTSSIAAEDWGDGQARLTGVRADISAITDELAGARFSLISFDSTAVLRTPLTDDASAVVTAATVMNQEITFYSKGSSISEANELLTQRLAEARASDPERANVVYYMGDGEQTLAEAPGSFADARADVDGGAVLGYGTAAGGRMPVFDGYGDEYSTKEYIKDKTKAGQPDAISTIDEGNLRRIASELGVSYEHRTATTSLDGAVADERAGRVASDEGRADSVIDLYWIFAIPLFLLILLDIALVARALGEIRPPRQGHGPDPSRDRKPARERIDA